MKPSKFNIEVDWGAEEIQELGKVILPEPGLVDFYKQRLQREIYINEDIDIQCVDYAYQIFQWNKEDKDLPVEQRKRIKIFIHTDGGCVASMNALISAILLSKTPIVTIGMGKIFSAGAMILISSNERLLLPHSRVMIHKGSSGIISDVNKIIDYSKFLEKDNDIIKQFILERTKITEEKYREVEDKDWYLLPEECVELGIADRIVDDIEDLF